MKCLKFSNSGLFDRKTNRVDFRGLSSLEELDLSQNNFSSLPSGIGFLPKLSSLSVRECIKLVSISDLPSNLRCLNAFGCSSMKSVRIPIQSKNSPSMVLRKCYMLEEIQGIEDPSNNYWFIDVDFPSDSSNNFLKSLAEVLSLSLQHTNIHINQLVSKISVFLEINIYIYRHCAMVIMGILLAPFLVTCQIG